LAIAAGILTFDPRPSRGNSEKNWLILAVLRLQITIDQTQLAGHPRNRIHIAPLRLFSGELPIGFELII
jgi:hypothetical protein